MGKKSTKEDKNIYQLAREEAGLTRAEAAEAMKFVSESRIEKIESGATQAQPEDIMAMEKAYKKPSLSNYYCSHECPIGKESVPEVKSGTLSEIVLELLNGINSVSKTKDRLVEITYDGKIDDTEIRDFAAVKEQLEELSLTVDALQLWVDEAINSGTIDQEKLEALEHKKG